MSCEDVRKYSYNIGKSGLPDIYIQSLRATGLRAEGVAIYQVNHERPCYNNYYVTLSYRLQTHHAAHI